MSDNSDSQNRIEEQANLSEGTSPSNSSYDESSRSTSSSQPKGATRQRRKRNSELESEDDRDVYAKPRKVHNSMAHMYKEIPDDA